MQYIYTAIFTPIEDGTGYYAKVPDLKGCITTGKDIPDAIIQITDAMNAWLVVAEDEGVHIPNPTRQSQLLLDNPFAVYSLICADTNDYRLHTDTYTVCKNGAPPYWMVNLAYAYGINCYQVIRDCLLHELNNVPMRTYTYLAVLEHGEDGGYGISFPDLPGCISCSDSLAEAAVMAAEAAELHVYGMERDGDAIPEPSVSLPDELTAGKLVMPITIHPDLYKLNR
jgi:predicted RNase H-like HicB family nuclease